MTSEPEQSIRAAHPRAAHYVGTPAIEPSLIVCRTSNGYLVNDSEEWRVIEDPEPWDLMRELADILGVTGSRYDPRRLTIGYAPGDKYEEER